MLLLCKGGKQDQVAAREYILKLYLRENPDPDRSCYSHFTTATGYMILLIILFKQINIFRLKIIIGTKLYFETKNIFII